MRPWWLQLSRYATPHASGLATVLLLTFTGIVVEVLMPWPLKYIVDYVLKDRDLPERVAWVSTLAGSNPSDLLMGLAVATVLLFLISRLIRMLGSYLQVGIGNRMVYALGLDLFDHMQRLSLRFHDKARTGDLVRRVTTDSQCVRKLIISVFLVFLTAVTTLVLMFAIMWRMDALLALVSLLIAFPLVLLMKVTATRMERRTYAQQDVEGQLMAFAEQSLSALPVVQAFSREELEDGRYRELTRSSIRAQIQLTMAQIEFKLGVNGFTALGTALVMGVGGMHVVQGTLTVGSLLVFLSYLASLYGPLENLAYLGPSFKTAAGQARRVVEVLAEDERMQDSKGAVDLRSANQPVAGRVAFEHVSFGYGRDRSVVNDVSFEALPGQTIALVGSSGAGKSTIASLICRFYDPSEGRVTLDGTDLSDIRLASLREQVSLVLQDPFILPIGAADNIAYGRPGADRDQIIAAARTANAHDFIARLPQGYDTPLGDYGNRLSGGEKQRIAIARAVLKDAPVMILDEPTSALDAGTEAQIMEALQRLMQNRTTIVIAHRLATIRGADCILVVEQGRIVERGTHDELIAAGRQYEHLVAVQTSTAAAD